MMKTVDFTAPPNGQWWSAPADPAPMAPPAPAPAVWKVLSYNIQAATPTRNYHQYVTHSWRQVMPVGSRVNALETIARRIAGYDLVALQEADGGSLRSGYLNQTRFLAHHGGFAHWHQQNNRKVSGLARVGNGLLSNVPPAEIEEHRLPGAIPGRGALAVRLKLGTGASPAGELLVVNIHLALGRRARSLQLAYLAAIVAGHRHVLVLGDFNCDLDSREMTEFQAATGLLAPCHPLHTFPSWRPKRALDHILASPTIRVRRAAVLDLPCSDHRPLAAEIELPAPPTSASTVPEPVPESVALCA